LGRVLVLILGPVLALALDGTLALALGLSQDVLTVEQ